MSGYKSSTRFFVAETGGSGGEKETTSFMAPENPKEFEKIDSIQDLKEILETIDLFRP